MDNTEDGNRGGQRRGGEGDADDNPNGWLTRRGCFG